MFNNYIIGIDPGLTGAICIIEFDKIINIFDMPVKHNGDNAKVKNIVDPKKLYDLLVPYTNKQTLAQLEFVASRPSNSPSSCFSLGDSYGCIRAVLDCLDIDVKFITPAKWKKSYNIESGSDKNVSLTLAKDLCIYEDDKKYFKLKKHHNRAEAFLIAKFKEIKTK